MNKNITTFFIVFITLILIDSIYLHFVGPWAMAMTQRIQHINSPIRYYSAAMVYVFLALGLTYFIIEPKKSIWEAALLGIVIYGVYDFTNLALLKNYEIMFALTDTIWGGILMAITTAIIYNYFS